MAKFATNASSAIWWPNWELMQVAFYLVLGPFCLWQCFFKVPTTSTDVLFPHRDLNVTVVNPLRMLWCKVQPRLQGMHSRLPTNASWTSLGKVCTRRGFASFPLRQSLWVCGTSQLWGRWTSWHTCLVTPALFCKNTLNSTAKYTKFKNFYTTADGAGDKSRVWT